MVRCIAIAATLVANLRRWDPERSFVWVATFCAQEQVSPASGMIVFQQRLALVLLIARLRSWLL